MRTLLLLTLLALPAAGQKTPEGRAPKSEFTFDGDLIEGAGDAPDVEFVKKTQRPKHDRLLKVRDSFRREVLSSAIQL